MTRIDRRRFPILIAAITALALAGTALALLVSPVQAAGGSAPYAPLGLRAEASHDSVVLTWRHQDADDIAGYVILRWDIDEQAPGFAVLEEDTGTKATTYTDSSVEPDTRYIYQVKAINEHGTSTGSRNVYVVRTSTDPTAGTEPGQVEEDTAIWIGIDISPASIEQGKYGRVTLAVTGLEAESRYSFLSDIVDDNGSNADTCEKWTGSTGVSTRDSVDATYTKELTIDKYCPVGSYSLRVVWEKYEEGVGYEYGGTVTKTFDVIPNDDPPRTDFERVDYITPLYPDPPATHGPLLIGTVTSPSPSQANVGIGIGGLVPDSDPETTDYVVSVRAVDEDNVPMEGCNEGPEVGSSFLIKIVPDSGKWKMELGTLSSRCASGLRIELLNGSFEYLFSDANSPATGVPVISGTARVGQTLTSDASSIADQDGLENATFAYQWLADDAAISGATGDTYTPVDGDEGKTIKVRVSFTDDKGNDETLTSAATATVEAAPTKAYITVVIAAGDDTVSWSDPDGCSSDYNIYKAITPSGNDSETSHIHLGSAAPGSTRATLDISHREDDRYPAVEVELYCGTYDAASSQNLLISSARLSIGGTSLVGINIREGTYSSAPLTALTISSGMLSPDFDRGGLGLYSAEVPSDVEVITLDPTVLTGYQTDFVKNPGLYTVTICPSPWRLNCVYTYGDGTTYGIVLSDAETDTEGFQINLDRGENRLGIGVHKGPVAGGAVKMYSLTVTRAANTPATGQPTISGTGQVGQRLTADPSGTADADGLANATFSYQWLSSRDTEIGGATSSTYTLQASDEGQGHQGAGVLQRRCGQCRDADQ